MASRAEQAAANARRGVLLTETERDAVRAVLAEKGEHHAARVFDMSSSALLRGAAGLPIRRPTATAVRVVLARLAAPSATVGAPTSDTGAAAA